MSSTTSSDRLTLLSYATFNYHIPIHNHSGSTWRSFSLRAVFMLIGQRASQMGGTFSPQWRAQGESETAHLERLFMIYWFYKKISWWIFNIIGW